MKRSSVTGLGAMTAIAAALFLPLACEEVDNGQNNSQGGGQNPPVEEADSSKFTWMEVNLEKNTHVKELTQEDDGSYTIVLPTSDPYIYMLPFENDLPAENTVFAVEYMAENPIDKTEFFFADAEDGVNGSHAMSGKGADATNEWTKFAVRMKASIKEFDWGYAGDYLRFDLGEIVTEGSVIRLRMPHMRPMTASEQAEEDAENGAAADKEEYAKAIRDYLGKEFSSAVTSVEVGADMVTVNGTCSGEGSFFLAEIPVFEDIFSMTKVPEEYRHEISSATFAVNTERIAAHQGVQYDRLLSKWAIYKSGETSDELVSWAKYADPDKICDKGPGLDRITLKNKKGLGGIVPGNLEAEVTDLDLGSGTLNIMPMAYMRMSQGGGCDLAYEYLGKTYWFNEERLKAEIDAPLQIAADHGMSVAAILLIQNAAQSADPELGQLLQHPDYSGTLYTMPDMTTPESVHAYAAMVSFLAERYSKADMRISHWIIHNEVDGGVHWTNMGPDVPSATYMDTYLKSMRLVYNIVHQYDANAEAFISLAHGWTEPAGGGWYSVTDLLDLMNGFSAAEGDFFWAPAYHSYSTEIANPRVWEDPAVSFSMQTANVSMRNLEVLDAWTSKPENMYRGTEKRRVWLSEAGVGSGISTAAYDDETLYEQAAGFAYSWLKIEALDGIEGLQWHNWYDHPDEGAKLGLRKYNDETWHGEAKPVWYAYKAAATDSQDEYFAGQGFAETVGEEWGKIQTVTE